MEIAAFEVRSSSTPGKSYRVVLFEADEGLLLLCDCEAGVHGSHCKHRLALWRRGDGVTLVEGHEEKFQECLDKLRPTTLYSTLAPLVSEADQLELEIRRRKSLRSGLMKRISAALRP